MVDQVNTAATQAGNQSWNKRITIQEPQWTNSATAQGLQQVFKLRIQNKFHEAQQNLENIFAAEIAQAQPQDDLSLRSVWLQNQILKTQY